MLKSRLMGVLASLFVLPQSLAQTHKLPQFQQATADYVEAFAGLLSREANGSHLPFAMDNPANNIINRPDYQLTASLDNDANKIIGSEI
jgi:hypothetical protein